MLSDASGLRLGEAVTQVVKHTAEHVYVWVKAVGSVGDHNAVDLGIAPLSPMLTPLSQCNLKSEIQAYLC